MNTFKLIYIYIVSMTRNSVKKWFIRTKIFLKRYLNFVNLLIFMQVAICY